MIVGGAFACCARTDSMTPRPVPSLRLRSTIATSTGCAQQLAHRIGLGRGESDHFDLARLGQKIAEPLAQRHRILDEKHAQARAPRASRALGRISATAASGSARSRLRIGAALLYETILDRVIREVGVRLRVHLLQDARPIRADCLVAEEKLRRRYRRPPGPQPACKIPGTPSRSAVRAAGRLSPPTSSARICATAVLMYLRPLSSVRIAFTTSSGTASFVM